MSEEQVKQAAVDAPEATAQPVVEGNDAQVKGGQDDDLDTLLKIYEQATDKSATATTTQPDTGAGADSDSDDPIVKRLEALERERQKEISERDFKPVVEKVRSAIPDHLKDVYDEEDVSDWINRMARTNPALQRAWIDRHDNPKHFEKVVDGLARKLSQKVAKGADKGTSEDRAAVTAAVRGASTKAPEAKAPDFSGLSDAAFQAEKDKLFGT